jgi:putative NADH-flavin reductase
MKILIFGASGATGHELTKQALSHGHVVTAFVRTPLKLKIQHENLNVVQGNVADLQAVDTTIKGHDAVISVLGASSPFRYDHAIVEGLNNIVNAMEAHRVHRLVYMSFVGVKDSRNTGGFVIKYIAPKLLSTEIKGHEIREKRIRDSALEWTIVRAPTLTNGKHIGYFRIAEGIKTDGFTVTISRADVADAMLRQLTSQTFLRKTPSVMY